MYLIILCYWILCCASSSRLENKERLKKKLKERQVRQLHVAIEEDWEKYWEIREQMIDRPDRKTFRSIIEKYQSYANSKGYKHNSVKCEIPKDASTDIYIKAINQLFEKFTSISKNAELPGTRKGGVDFRITTGFHDIEHLMSVDGMASQPIPEKCKHGWGFFLWKGPVKEEYEQVPRPFALGEATMYPGEKPVVLFFGDNNVRMLPRDKDITFCLESKNSWEDGMVEQVKQELLLQEDKTTKTNERKKAATKKKKLEKKQMERALIPVKEVSQNEADSDMATFSGNEFSEETLSKEAASSAKPRFDSDAEPETMSDKVDHIRQFFSGGYSMAQMVHEILPAAEVVNSPVGFSIQLTNDQVSTGSSRRSKSVGTIELIENMSMAFYGHPLKVNPRNYGLRRSEITDSNEITDSEITDSDEITDILNSKLDLEISEDIQSEMLETMSFIGSKSMASASDCSICSIPNSPTAGNPGPTFDNLPTLYTVEKIQRLLNHFRNNLSSFNEEQSQILLTQLEDVARMPIMSTRFYE